MALAKVMGLSFLEKSVVGTRKILENEKYQNDASLDLNRRRQGRFEGLLEFHKGHFPEAVAWYDKSIALFNKADSVDMRANVLELKAFKSEGDIWQGEVKKGIQEGFTNYEDFDHTPEGQYLSTNKRQQWENWRAGCVTKLATALLGTDNLDTLSLSEEKPRLLAMFQEVYAYNGLFPKRRGQLEKLWQKLQKHGFTVENLT